MQDAKNKEKKPAFTIAEVIVTLGLVGVIFVITVSNINLKPSND